MWLGFALKNAIKKKPSPGFKPTTKKNCMVVQSAQNVGVPIFAKCHSYNETSLGCPKPV